IFWSHQPPFPTNTETPQGDSLSPVLFVVYLEAALRDFQTTLHDRFNIFINMFAYADDIDIFCNSQDDIDCIIATAPIVLAKWSLQTNPEKTEITTVLNTPASVNSSNSYLWHTTKKLGSLLDDSQDIVRRKSLENLAFHNMWKSRLRRNHVSEKTRLRLYNSYVKPILL
ncbi:unnamed protein product, partial [Aphanomyces euteiches]